MNLHLDRCLAQSDRVATRRTASPFRATPPAAPDRAATPAAAAPPSPRASPRNRAASRLQLAAAAGNRHTLTSPTASGEDKYASSDSSTDHYLAGCIDSMPTRRTRSNESVHSGEDEPESSENLMSTDDEDGGDDGEEDGGDDENEDAGADRGQGRGPQPPGLDDPKKRGGGAQGGAGEKGRGGVGGSGEKGSGSGTAEATPDPASPVPATAPTDTPEAAASVMQENPAHVQGDGGNDSSGGRKPAAGEAVLSGKKRAVLLRPVKVRSSAHPGSGWQFLVTCNHGSRSSTAVGICSAWPGRL